MYGTGAGAGDCADGGHAEHVVVGILDDRARNGRGSVHAGRVDDRHVGEFNLFCAAVLAEVGILVNLRHLLVRDEASETAFGDVTHDGRGLEGEFLASDAEFVQGLRGLGEQLEVCGSHDESLGRSEHGFIHDGLLRADGEVLGARCADFFHELFAVLGVHELIPEVEFHGGVLVVHVGVDFGFVHRVRVGDDAVVNGAWVGEVAGDLHAVLLALEFGLRELGLCALDVVHSVTHEGGDEFQFLAVGECHAFILRAQSVRKRCRCSVNRPRTYGQIHGCFKWSCLWSRPKTRGRAPTLRTGFRVPPLHSYCREKAHPLKIFYLKRRTNARISSGSE